MTWCYYLLISCRSIVDDLPLPCPLPTVIIYAPFGMVSMRASSDNGGYPLTPSAHYIARLTTWCLDIVPLYVNHAKNKTSS